MLLIKHNECISQKKTERKRMFLHHICMRQKINKRKINNMKGNLCSFEEFEMSISIARSYDDEKLVVLGLNT